jgi:hypothetical protein
MNGKGPHHSTWLAADLAASDCRYRQSELVHARWAMLGVAGILVQEIVKPDIFWYYAGLPENLPKINFGGPTGEVRTAHTHMHARAVSMLQVWHKELKTNFRAPMAKTCSLSRWMHQ